MASRDKNSKLRNISAVLVIYAQLQSPCLPKRCGDVFLSPTAVSLYRPGSLRRAWRAALYRITSVRAVQHTTSGFFHLQVRK